MARQTTLFKRTNLGPAREGEGAQFSSDRQFCISQTVIESLIGRFEELDTADCDIKVLLQVAAELRQWIMGQRNLDLKEQSSITQSDDPDPLDALDEFRRGYNAVRQTATME
jgi:hypothetical protein